MGRKKTGRDIALYVRINKENDKFIEKMCKRTGHTRTSLIDSHLNMLRNSMRGKTRNYFPKESAATTK